MNPTLDDEILTLQTLVIWTRVRAEELHVALDAQRARRYPAQFLRIADIAEHLAHLQSVTAHDPCSCRFCLTQPFYSIR